MKLADSVTVKVVRQPVVKTIVLTDVLLLSVYEYAQKQIVVIITEDA